jgi:hypothetical protein
MNCIVCNKPFDTKSHLRLTCSKECALANKRKTTKESYHKKKNGEAPFSSRQYNPDYVPIPKIEQRRRYREKNREKIRVRALEYHKEKRDNVVKNSTLKKSFNMTLEDYNQMLLKQNNKCAICNNFEKSKTKYGVIRKLAVDHCHQTGKIRDLLCSQCNRALGGFRDSTEILQNAIDYLKKHQESSEGIE